MTTIARLAATGFLLAALALSGSAVAHAHAALISSDPADNASLDTAPTRVSATFNEPLQTTFAALTVVGPDRNLWSSGAPQIDGAVASIALRPLGPAGTYTVHYRVTSADGHPVSGSWSFTLTAPGTGTPGPPVSADDSAGGSLPVWPFAVGAVVLVGAAAVWAARRGS